MNISLSKRICSHRFIDQYTGKCLHCAEQRFPSSFDKSRVETKPEDDRSLDIEHYERLVLMLDNWKTRTIKKIESIHKTNYERLRDEFERQQLLKRVPSHFESHRDKINEKQQITLDLKSSEFRFIYSANLDTEYSLLAASSETVVVHDGRTLKLFDQNLRPVIAVELAQTIRGRMKIVDLCYVSFLSVYLILYENSLWTFEPSSKPTAISSMKSLTYISMTVNNRDLFVLDQEGTVEQRSLVSWIYLRRYSRQHFLHDNIHEQMINIRCHSVDLNKFISIIRTNNNRRGLMIFQHFGSNTFKLLNRVIFPSINIYSIMPLHLSHVWIVTTCEKKAFFFVDEKDQENRSDSQQLTLTVDCNYQIKMLLPFNRILVH